jgi:hypothetical protein
MTMPCPPVGPFTETVFAGFSDEGHAYPAGRKSCPGGWTLAYFRATMVADPELDDWGCDFNFYDASNTHIKTVGQYFDPNETNEWRSDGNIWSQAERDAVRYVECEVWPFGSPQTATWTWEIYQFDGCAEVVAVANTAYVQIMG